MLTKVRTATLNGIEGSVVTVETDIRRGLPMLTVVGLADTTIRESCKRIKPAIMNSGYYFPNEKVTVNLVPGKRKEGSHFDLPMAMGIILHGHDNVNLDDIAFLGEVSLDGKINHINGALPMAMSLRKAGIENIVLPLSNASEVSVLNDINILPVTDLRQAADHVFGNKSIDTYINNISPTIYTYDSDFSQVIGQETVKRAVTVGVAGNHGILMVGGMGCGKTMIAQRIPSIMPELTYEEKLEIMGIYSVAGLLGENSRIVERRPFRSPHHTASSVALIGGGRKPRPGEISLAHRGVLFLDELGEFENKAIDAMRQPIEEGFIRINRNLDEVVFPSRVMLVAAANPCKCGNLWDEKRICTCTGKQIDNYSRKLCGPFSDRIDMHIKMNPVSSSEAKTPMESGSIVSSCKMKKDVENAIYIQRERYKNTRYDNNGSLDERGVSLFCELDDKCSELMEQAYDKLNLTMRAYSKLLKVSRTIADLDGAESINENHVAEALMYRISDFRSANLYG